jgi:phenylalanine-4-hydroxylase
LKGDSKRKDKSDDDDQESDKKESKSIQSQALKAIIQKREEKSKEIANLNIELDSAKAREDTSLQHTLEKKIAKDEKQLKTLDKQTKLASQAKGFIDYVSNFDISTDEILDEMNVERDDTLRLLLTLYQSISNVSIN